MGFVTMETYENPVVKEIPVFITRNSLNKLVIYQYPLEDQLRTEHMTVAQCRTNEKSEAVIELERDTSSANYNSRRGEQMAINVDGTSYSETAVYPKKLMDRQTLVSKAVEGTNLAVGILQDGELHLTPAAGLNIFRPSFQHLDLGDKKNKEDKDKDKGDTSEDDDGAKQILVKFARQETERAKQARVKSYGFLTQQNAEQKWKRMDYYDEKSSQAEVEIGKLFCKRPDDRVEDHGRTGLPAEKTKLLLLAELADDASHGLPLTRLHTLPTLLDKVRTIMSEARLLELASLNRLLKDPVSSSDTQERIRVVQHVAVLVQGCWVVQSDVIIGKDAAPNGVPAPLARCARDYMLYQFTKSRTLTRQKLMEVVKLPGDVVKLMLEEVAALNKAKEWEFKLPTDFHFIANHPEVVQRQQAKWELRLEQLVAGLRPPEPGMPPNRNRRRSGRDSFSSDNEGAEGRRMLKARRTARVSESKLVENPAHVPT